MAYSQPGIHQQYYQQQQQQQYHSQYNQTQQQPCGQLQPGQAPPPNSEHYGSYGQQTHKTVYQAQAWQCMNGQISTEEEFQLFFNGFKIPAYDAIQAEELMRILNETPSIKQFYGISWSLELCKIMIAMLDRSKDGLMQYPEFRELIQCLNYWYEVFCTYDVDKSGYIESIELARCIRERLLYRLSPKAMETLLKRYAKLVQRGDQSALLIAFDDFVSCAVRLRAYTEAFRARDKMIHQNQETGNCHFEYDDFLQCVMCL